MLNFLLFRLLIYLRLLIVYKAINYILYGMRAYVMDEQLKTLVQVCKSIGNRYAEITFQSFFFT